MFVAESSRPDSSVALPRVQILDNESEDDPKTQMEVAGTPGYAAPEVFRRIGYGKNQDVFGVGVIAYNL